MTEADAGLLGVDPIDPSIEEEHVELTPMVLPEGGDGKLVGLEVGRELHDRWLHPVFPAERPDPTRAVITVQIRPSQARYGAPSVDIPSGDRAAHGVVVLGDGERGPRFIVASEDEIV